MNKLFFLSLRSWLMSIDSDVIRGHVDTIILKTLTTGDKYGYEIIKEIEQKSQGTYELKQPTLYSCLKRLENQGLISGYSKNSDIGGKRHYYKLTKKGRESYENSMQDWFNSRSIIDSLMGSKPTELTFANDEDAGIITPSPDQILDQIDEVQEPILDIQKDDEDDETNSTESLNEFAQMVIDESSSITQESEPRDFENVNLDEEDVALLGDYYKTDENQIDLFADNEFSSTSTSYNDEDDDTEEDNYEYNEDDDEDEDDKGINDENDKDDDNIEYFDEHPFTPQFKNFSGADLNKYKNNSATNYFDSISSDNTDFTPIVDDTRYDEDDENDEKIENLSSSNSFLSFNYFGNYGQFDDEENIADEKEDKFELTSEENEDEQEEKREFIFPSFRASQEETEPEENENETLHFGFGGYEEQDDEDNMSIPSNFDEVGDIEETNSEEEPHAPISIFGEKDDFSSEEPLLYDQQTQEDLSEPIYSSPEAELYTRTYISDQTTDLKPINIGTYSEPEHKEKLNQLSSYTKANYETKPAEFAEETTRIEAKTLADLKEDFAEVGIEIRNYQRPEKEPLKDKKYLLVNKIKFATSWIVFGVMALVLLGTYFLANNWGYNNLMLVSDALPTYFYYLMAGVVAISVPITYTIIYLLNKTKKVKPNYNAVISLIFALLFFVVCLNIIYTFNILNGFTKFTQTDYNHLLWLLPSVVSLVIVFQSIVYTILFKTKRFNA